MNYQAWEECRKSLELELNQDEFSTWISPLAYSEEQDEFGMQAVTLLAPNDFIKEHVKQNYDSVIKQYLSRSLDSENLSLNYDLFNSPKPLITKDKSKKIPFPLNQIGASFLGLPQVRKNLCKLAYISCKDSNNNEWSGNIIIQV